MNREIEFRAWLKNQNKMINVSQINFTRKNVSDCFFNYYKFNEIEIMQYTGLKDKNGVKIFEGDIIRIYGGEKMFGYYEFDQVKVIKELEDLVMLSNLDCEIEVIGNIYENPELLEAEDEKED